MKTYEYCVRCQLPDGSKFLCGEFQNKQDAINSRDQRQKQYPQNHYYITVHVYAASWKDRDISNHIYSYYLETGERIKY